MMMEEKQTFIYVEKKKIWLAAKLFAFRWIDEPYRMYIYFWLHKLLFLYFIIISNHFCYISIRFNEFFEMVKNVMWLPFEWHKGCRHRRIVEWMWNAPECDNFVSQVSDKCSMASPETLGSGTEAMRQIASIQFLSDCQTKCDFHFRSRKTLFVQVF